WLRSTWSPQRTHSRPAAWRFLIRTCTTMLWLAARPSSRFMDSLLSSSTTSIRKTIPAANDDASKPGRWLARFPGHAEATAHPRVSSFKQVHIPTENRNGTEYGQAGRRAIDGKR